MRKAILITLSAPLAVVLLLVIVLSVMYSPVYVYRLIRFNVADVYDYQYFENRKIKGSHQTFDFAVHPDEPFVESLFQERVKKSGFDSFDQWAKESQTFLPNLYRITNMIIAIPIICSYPC